MRRSVEFNGEHAVHGDGYVMPFEDFYNWCGYGLRQFRVYADMSEPFIAQDPYIHSIQFVSQPAFERAGIPRLQVHDSVDGAAQRLGRWQHGLPQPEAGGDDQHFRRCVA